MPFPSSPHETDVYVVGANKWQYSAAGTWDAYSGVEDGTRPNYSAVTFPGSPSPGDTCYVSAGGGAATSSAGSYSDNYYGGGSHYYWEYHGSGYTAGAPWVFYYHSAPYVPNSVSIDGTLAMPSTAQPISGASSTIPITAANVRLTGSTDYTLTSAPTIADGSSGQIIRIINVGTGVFTFQDEDASGIATNLKLSADTISLAEGDTLEVQWSGTVLKWCQTTSSVVGSVADGSITRSKFGVDAVEQLIRTRNVTGVTYTSGSTSVTAAAGTFRASDVGRSAFSDLTVSGAYDPYLSPGLVNRITSVLSDGSGATLNWVAIKSGTATMFIGGISATTTSGSSRGLDIRADEGPWGVRVFTTETLTSSTVRSMMDFGFSHFMSVTVNGATTSVPAPTSIGPAGLLATLYGAVRYTTASPQYGGTVSVLDTLTVQNSSATYGNLLSSVLGFISQPYITADGSGGVVGFTPQLDAGGRIPAVSYWAQPVFTTTSSGALNAFVVDHTGFESDAKVNAGTILGRWASYKSVGAPIVAQAQVSASGGGELGLGSDLTAMSAATIRVADCSSFPTAGTCDVEVVDSAGAYLGRCKFTYTGKTGTTKLTGCTLYSDAVTGYIRAASARILLLAKQTTIHSSVGSTDVTTLSSSTVKVTSTTDFGSSGTATVETTSGGITTVGRFTYTSLTTSGGAPALGGCTYVSGTGNFIAGASIAYGGGIVKERTGLLIEPMTRAAVNGPITYGWTATDYLFRVNQFGGIGVNLGAGASGFAFTATGYAQTPQILIRRANGTQHAPSQTLAADSIAKLSYATYTSSSAFGSTVDILQVLAAENHTSTAQGTYVELAAATPGQTGGTVAWTFGKIAGGLTHSQATVGSNVYSTVNWWHGGNSTSKAQTLASDYLGRLDWIGSTSAAGNPYTDPVARIEAQASQNYTSTASGSLLRFYITAGNTTGTLTEAMRHTYPTSGVAQVRVGYLVVGDTTMATAATAGTGLYNVSGSALAGNVLIGNGDPAGAITTTLGGFLYGANTSAGNFEIKATSHATPGIIKLMSRTTVGESISAADAANVATAFSITSAATNDDPTMNFAFVRSTTTTNATKTIGKIPFTAGSILPVVVYVTGHHTDTAEGGVFYRLEGAFKASTLNGSTPVQIGSTTTTAIATDASVTVAPTLSVVSSEVVVQVKLNATENWTWHAHVLTLPLDT